MTVANVQVTQVLLKRGTTARSLAYTGPLGEPTMDTDLNSIRIHDGVTPGGHLISGGGGGGTYGNTQVAVYLASGNVTSNILTTATVRAGNVRSNSYLYANGAPLSFNSLINGSGNLVLASSGNVNLSNGTQLQPGYPGVGALPNIITLVGDQAWVANTSGANFVGVDGTSAQIGASSALWNFNPTGVLTLPSGSSFYDTPDGSLAWGYYAGGAGPGFTPSQGSYDLAIGTFSGQINQSGYSIAIGYNSGTNNQGTNSIAIGQNTGYTSQGNNAISIGGSNGPTTQVANSIILNANATGLSANVSGFFVNPVRNYYDAGNTIMVVYNTVTKELSYSNVILASVTAARYSNANVAAYLPSYTGLIAGTITTANQPNINQLGVLNTLTAAGDVSISGNLTVTGNINFIGNVTNQTVTGNSGQFFGDTNGFGALYAGISTGYNVQPQIAVQVSTNYNDYGGINMQNINSGARASSDLIITADNGNASDTFIDIGIGSSTYNYPGYAIARPNDAYINVFGNAVTGGGNLIINTQTANDILFVVGGGNANNEVMRITSSNIVRITSTNISNSSTSGALTVAGGVGVSGTVTVANTVVVQGLDLFANVSSLANQIVTANTAVVGYVNDLNTAMAANVQNSLNATVNANIGMKNYVDNNIVTVNTSINAVTTAWTANARNQETTLTNLDLKIISANTYSNNNINAANATISALSANVGSYYIATNIWLSNLQSNVTSINANLGSYYIYANANAAAQAGQIQSTNANIGSYYVYANLTQAGQNVWLGNLQSNVTSINANLGSFYTYANLTYLTAGGSYGNSNVASYLTANPQPGTYSNTNVAAYLPTDSTITGIQTSITNKTLSQLNTGSYVATLSSGGVFAAPSIQSDGPVVLTYLGASNTLYKIAAVDVNNLAIYGTRNTYFDATLLTLNAATGNATVSGNVVAPNYLFANGVNILSTVGAGSYGNTQVAQFLPTYTGNISAGNASVTSQFTVPFGVSQTATDIQRIILAQSLIA